jgi:hypothetical protein
MPTVFPGSGALPAGTPTTSPAPTPAEPRGTEPEQPSAAGGVPADHPSGIGVILAVAYFEGDSTGDESGKSGVNQIMDDLGTLT